MKIIGAAASDDTSLPLDGPRGFSTAGLRHLHFIDGSDTTNIIANYGSAGGTTGVVNGASGHSSAALLANGGIRLRGNTYLPIAAEIDVTLPFTFMWHGTVDIPTSHDSVTTWVSPILATDQYTARGFTVYATKGAVIPSPADSVVPNFRYVINSAQQAPASLSAAAAYQYTEAASWFASLTGTSMQVRGYQSGTQIANFATTINTTGMITNSSAVADPTMKLVAGSPSTVFAEANLMVECIALYDRILSDADCVSMAAAADQVRAARGR
ncbi:MAG TPA: hypothetical protein VIQ53_15745 [Inquilinus sp.]